MIDYKYSDLFLKDGVDKQLHIVSDDETIHITNSELHFEQFELTESLCSQNQLKFGSCEASVLKFKISNVFLPMIGKWLDVSMVLDKKEDNPFIFGRYKVVSDIPTVDKKYRNVTAYDAMYDIINANVAGWYNTILPNAESTVTLRAFRDSFLSNFGIGQEEITLINDAMTVTKTVEPTELSGQMVITAICEINGCFGHIGQDGRFRYIHLKEMVEGLYPSDTLYPREDLYPSEPKNAEKISGSHYINASYEDYKTERITKLQIRQEEDDIGCIYGSGDNCYIVQDNFLVYGKSSVELQKIAENLYFVISRVWYRPAHVEAKGNPCLEVGDGIRLSTSSMTIYTYVLRRTMKGIQALRDTYDAEGELRQSENANSVHKSIIRLKGKTNKLTRTIDETRLEIQDIEKGLSTKIQQNANAIILEANRATAAEGKLSASIKVESDRITAEVARATVAEGNLSAQIGMNAQQILLKVSKDNVISEINQTAESIKIKAERIDLVGLVTANEFVSKYATIETLNVTRINLENLVTNSFNAVSGRVGSLEADHVSVSSFNSVNARLQNVEANYISAGTVKANYMEVANWTSSGYIDADRISANTIISKLSNADIGSIRAMRITEYMNYGGTVVSWRTKTIGGTVITYLGPEA